MDPVSPSNTIDNQAVSQGKTIRMPDTLVIIFFVAIAAAILTYFIPIGSFQTQDVNYVVDGVEKSRSVIDPNSFTYEVDASGEPILKPVALFEGHGGVGFFNFAFEGLIPFHLNT